ncbi:hypothetical protein KC19_12G128900 [Ceratodon purpureus]|uniref:Glutaredoxin domain-containing protein n=1 Tax=Ceratodon purpureus TaxID=3225 RepID=A0A8T0G6M0_CERPU|nr:hypothetical protein KC19_12G128900 [Ceratodon purpureus]
MATAMRSVQASTLAGRAASIAEVSTSAPTSLRCGWKQGVQLATGSFSASVPCRQLRIRPVAPRSAFGPPGGALTPELKEALDKYLSENKVVLFMKGNKSFPQCGFSNTCVQILNNLEVPYETVNILEDENLRQGMKLYSAWPTFPQLYIDGEFFGGCDITLDAYQSGELKELLEKAMLS